MKTKCVSTLISYETDLKQMQWMGTQENILCTSWHGIYIFLLKKQKHLIKWKKTTFIVLLEN